MSTSSEGHTGRVASPQKPQHDSDVGRANGYDHTLTSCLSMEQLRALLSTSLSLWAATLNETRWCLRLVKPFASREASDGVSAGHSAWWQRWRSPSARESAKLRAHERVNKYWLSDAEWLTHAKFLGGVQAVATLVN